jgi:hypothetical protein
VAFSNDFATGWRVLGGRGDLDSPGVPGGAEHRLFVVPADPPQFEIVRVTPETASAVHHPSNGGIGDRCDVPRELHVDRETPRPCGPALAPTFVISL